MKYLVFASILLLGSCTQRYFAGSFPNRKVRNFQRNFPGSGGLWEKERSSEIEERVAAIENRINELKDLIVELKIAELERKGEKLNSHVETQEDPSQVASVPLEPISIIMGTVTGVSPRAHVANVPLEQMSIIMSIATGVSTCVNLIVINVGEKQGVQVGYKFTIFRGSSYIGRMIVEKTYPQQSAGRVLFDETKDRVLVGDGVIWVGNR
jgi:hypothetical protein